MNPIRSRGDSTLVRGATLLVTVLMLAVINVWPLLDVGYNDTSSPHVEEPDGSPAHHGAKHDHALCGLIGSAHVLPGTTHVIATAPTHTLDEPPPVRDLTAVGFTCTVHHSRAPPSA